MTGYWCGAAMISDLLPCAILVPSLDRPQNLEDIVANIHDNTPEEHFILFCVSDDKSMRILDGLGEWFLDDSDTKDRRYVTRMNKLLEHIDDAKTIFFGSDDVRHHRGWLTAALRVMDADPFPRCVVVNDLHNANGTQALIRRSYLQSAVFDAPGLAFHPDYGHNFADNEMFLTAACAFEFARAPDSIVEHLHPVFGSANALPWDPTYTNAQEGWDADLLRFQQRSNMINNHNFSEP